jgi:deoxyribonuclease V
MKQQDLVSLDDLREMPDLEGQLWELLALVPAGQVATYGLLADALGDRKAARWIGHVLLHHDHQPGCRCHRVVRSDGQPGAFITGEPTQKADLLTAEGVEIANGRVCLDNHLANVHCESPPLVRLRQFQELSVARISLTASPSAPTTVAAVDVSYGPSGEAVAAYAIFNTDETGAIEAQPDWYVTSARRVSFPYISSYLAFRELPVLLDLMEKVRAAGKLADVVLVDGSGILHPRRIGIATLLGIVADVATIGVTKKRLCGKVDLRDAAPGELRPVTVDEEPLGWAYLARSGSKRPLFVSPGHRSNVTLCHELFAMLSKVSGKLPSPIHFVDRLSRREAAARSGPTGMRR